MKKLILLALMLGLGETVHAAPPNIVYILADDMGYGDIHCLGGERSKIPTPHLDGLASAGMTFTEAHSSSAVCTPSRYSILTGRYCWRSSLQSSVLWGFSPPLISADRLTVPKLLKQSGYSTACIGKWHLGLGVDEKHLDQAISDGPTTRGFDYFFGVSASLDMPPYAFIENDRFIETPTETKELYAGRPGPTAPSFQMENALPILTKKAVDYVKDNAGKGKPFFLYLALTSPHTPIVPTKAWQGKSGLGPYGDFVMETDWSVGEILNAIEQCGISDNTLVLFASDNGCSPAAGIPHLEQSGHFPSELRRGYKSDIWDGGHRVPFLVRWPGKIRAGSTCDEIVCLSDLMATCADLLNVPLPENAGEDSVSFLPALKEDKSKHLREAIIHHSINGFFAVRQGKWKLDLCRGSGGWSPSDQTAPYQLYDVSADGKEQVNLSAAHPEIVQQLTGLLEYSIAAGRSTPGATQKNDVGIVIHKPEGQQVIEAPDASKSGKHGGD